MLFSSPIISGGGSSGGSLAIGTAVTSGTAGSILYIGSTGLLAQTNPGLTFSATILNLSSDAVNRTITIGNITGSTALNQLVGTGNYSLDGVGVSTYTIGTSTTTGVMNFGGTAGTGKMTFGNSTATQNLAIADGTGGGNINIASNSVSANVSIGNSQIAGSIQIGGTGANTGAMSIAPGTGAQTINIANSTGGKTVNLGTGAGANLLSFGSTNTTSTLTLRTGTGNFSLDGVGATTYTIGTSTTTGTMTIGGTAQTGTIKIGESTGALSTEIGGGSTAGKTLKLADGTAGNVAFLNNGANTGANTTHIASGTSGANNTLNLNTGTGTAGIQDTNIGASNLRSQVNLKGTLSLGLATLITTTSTLPLGFQVYRCSGTISVTLPTPVTTIWLRVKNVGTNTVTVLPSTGTFDTGTSFALATFPMGSAQAQDLYFNGTNWELY